MTMLELAERLGNAGFRWLVDSCRQPGPDGTRPIDDDRVGDRLARFDIEISGLRSLCRDLVEDSEAGAAGPADASIVKLFYSELLQRMTDFGAEIGGLAAQTALAKAGVQRLGVRVCGCWTSSAPGSGPFPAAPARSSAPSSPNAACGCRGNRRRRDRPGSRRRRPQRPARRTAFGGSRSARCLRRGRLAGAGPAPGWLGLEAAEEHGGAGATFAEVAVVCEELGRAAAPAPYLGGAVLAVGALNALRAHPPRDELLTAVASGAVRAAVAVSADHESLDPAAPFTVEYTQDGPRLHGRSAFVPDADGAARLLLAARGPDGNPVLVDVDPAADGIALTGVGLLDPTRRPGTVVAESAPLDPASVWRFAADPRAALAALADRAAVAVACDSLGLAEAMLAATVSYAGVRHQFGRPIGSFQAVKHACADMAVALAVSRRLVRAAVDALAAGRPDAGAAAARAKSHATETAVDVAGRAMQLHGGIGYTWESGIHVYLKRAAVNRAVFGAPAAHRRRLARRYRD